ncbi:N-acetylglucosaminyl-phosphatidylinositol de-N-acetylase [Danio rerio]|uniref:N-acetylglucosaminylphosphatidylinositol deacetylase n=2 Tax=Danio rerio TaxID=7955 RepID=A0A8M1P3K2_DANRE|nr:N-acetylglucosaminyl-phosphatidylinositol de-N-acetylase [Danio rerio]|eukprot:NP_001243584.1 N-acetylglucosaminyl-phosphatidylinositol de-N-acetylase [Danio rerio]
MFVFFTISFVLVAYAVFIKFVYYRHSQLWPHALNKISTPLYTVGNSRFCPAQERSGALFPNSEDENPRETRALIVTAHPDDECMFFAPTVLRLVESRAAVCLLCLSTGNYNNQGLQRKKELLDSCAVLGIPANHVSIIDDKELPDDPAVQWSTALISSLILKHIQNYAISLVLTFDGRGVSGHANHIAIYKTLSHLASAGRIHEGCQIFSLHSISIIRKYLSILELPVSWLLPSDFCCIIGREDYKRAKKAMLCHRSQLLWFRRLYILFSRYMFVNTFQAITAETKNVKIY